MNKVFEMLDEAVENGTPVTFVIRDEFIVTKYHKIVESVLLVGENSLEIIAGEFAAIVDLDSVEEISEKNFLAVDKLNGMIMKMIFK